MKVFCGIYVEPGFCDQPKVINGINNLEFRGSVFLSVVADQASGRVCYHFDYR